MVKFMLIVLSAYFAISKGEHYTNWNETEDEYESEITYNELVATWPTEISPGWFSIPKNLSQAWSMGWTEIAGSSPSPYIKALGFKGDPRYIVNFLNQTGRIVGWQVGMPCKDIANVPIDYTNHIGVEKKILNGEEYITGSVLIIENPKGNYQIWVENNKTRYERIPILAERVPLETRLLKKKCIPTMGDPHYYAINSTTNCSNIFPWVALQRGRYIVGIVFQAIGTITAGPWRTWTEKLPPGQLAQTIPDAPRCLNEHLNKYGVISIHTWFIKDPWNIKCSKENLPISPGEHPSSGKPSRPGGSSSYDGSSSYNGSSSHGKEPSSPGNEPSSYGKPSFPGKPSSSGEPSWPGEPLSPGGSSYNGSPSHGKEPSSPGNESSSSGKQSSSGGSSSHNGSPSYGEGPFSGKPSFPGKPSSSGEPSSPGGSPYKNCRRAPVQSF